jgi:hypothetical protein
MTQIIIVDKTGTLKSLNVKDYKEEELFKKAGFKKVDGFIKHTDWSVKMDGQKYSIALYGKLDGKANMENKYDFPPPVDNMLFFGACVLIASVKTEKGFQLTNLTLELWEKVYEKLFGGFENLALTAAEDEEEEDELAAVPKSKKTKKGGYLKDGFVVDSSENEDNEGQECSSESESEFDDSEDTSEPDIKDDELLLSDEIGSELSEESYE